MAGIETKIPTNGEDIEKLRQHRVDQVDGLIKEYFSYNEKVALMNSMADSLRRVGLALPRKELKVGPTGTKDSHQGNIIDAGIQRELHSEIPDLLPDFKEPFAVRYEHLKRVQWHYSGVHALEGAKDKGFVFIAELDGTSNFAIKYALYKKNGFKGDFRAESALTLTLCHSDHPFFPLAVAIYDFDKMRTHSALFVEGDYQAFVDGMAIRKDDVRESVKTALAAVENPRLYVANYVNDFHVRSRCIEACLDEYRCQTGRRIEVKSGTQSTVRNGLGVICLDECDTIGAYDSRGETVPDPENQLTQEQEKRLKERLGEGYQLACLKYDDAISIATLSQAYGCPVFSVRGSPLWMQYNDIDLLNPNSTNQITMAQIWPEIGPDGKFKDRSDLIHALYKSVEESHKSFQELLNGNGNE